MFCCTAPFQSRVAAEAAVGGDVAELQRHFALTCIRIATNEEGTEESCRCVSWVKAFRLKKRNPNCRLWGG